MRAIWKGSFLKNNKYLDKASTIFSEMIKKKFLIQSGNEVKHILIERHMVGYKLGEFVNSRKISVLHKKKVLNKNKNKKK